MYIIYATPKINDIKEVYFTSLILLLLFLIKFQFPLGTIYEQHNIYLPPDGNKFPTYKSLPAPVNSFFEKEFLSIYPKDKWQTNEYGTWRGIGRDKHVEISKSADGLYDRKYLKKNNLSRIVHDIQFSDIASFNASFLDKHYNWYDWTSQLKRDKMPFFVSYQFDPQFLGSSLHYKGSIMIERDGDYQVLSGDNNFKSLIIDENILNSKIWTISIDNNLELKLIKNLTLRFFDLFHNLIILLIFLVILRCYKIVLSKDLIFIHLIIIFVLFEIYANVGSLYVYENFFVTTGGNDGQTYNGLASSMLEGFLNRDIKEIFRGGQDIFYYMPGMPYFIFLSYFVFGQTSLWLIGVFVLLVIVFWRIFQIYMNEKLAFIYISLFLLSIIPFQFFRTYKYIGLLNGYQPEVLATLFFMTAFYYIVKLFEKKVSSNCLFLVGLLFAFTIFLRPNTSITIGLIYIFLFIIFLTRKKINYILKVSSGLSVVIFIPIHNYYYGKDFVLLTSSAFISANYKLPVWDYFRTFTDLDTFLKVINHLRLWLGNFNPLFIIGIFFLVFATYKFHTFTYKVKLLILATIGMQLPLLFWHPNDRYAYLAWLLLVILITHLLISKQMKFRKITKYLWRQ